VTYKQFYILSLTLTTLLFTIRFILIFLDATKKRIGGEFSKAVLFIALFSFSFFLVGLYKITDQTEFSLKFLFNDRILSSLSNIFLLSSVIYFPYKIKYLHRFYEKKENWVMIIFLFFGVIISLFTVFDKLASNAGQVFQIALIVIDSLISTIILVLFGYVLSRSMQLSLSNKGSIYFFQIIVVLIVATQVALPLSKIYHEVLLWLYPYFLILFFVSNIFLLQNILLFLDRFVCFHSQSLSTIFPVSKEIVDNEARSSDTTAQLYSVFIRYDTIEKKYKIQLTIRFDEDRQKLIAIENSKILQPFSYWILFAVAKKMNIKIYNSDLAVARFRMIEYIHKNYPDVKLVPETIFENDKGYYEIITDATNIIIEDLDLLLDKMQVKDVFLKHLDNFKPLLKIHIQGTDKGSKAVQNRLELVLQFIKEALSTH
jgi:hypothetical protein